MSTLTDQLRRYSVALISLAVALASLGYNTWRNERTEANRNVRQAGIEVLLLLGELQRVAFFAHFDRDGERGSPRSGWAYVLTIRDLGSLLDGGDGLQATQTLFATWSERWDDIDEDAAYQSISSGIDRTREAVLRDIAALD